MALRPIFSVIASVELGLGALLLLAIVVGLGIREPDDAWALGFSGAVLAVAPVAALVLNKSDAAPRKVLVAIFLAGWPAIVWWLVAYA